MNKDIQDFIVCFQICYFTCIDAILDTQQSLGFFCAICFGPC